MILLCGIPTERPLALLRDRLQKLGVPYVVFNQREFANSRLNLEVAARGKVEGNLTTAGRTYPLSVISAVYLRLMDHQELPEFKELPEKSELRAHCRELHERLIEWCEISPSRVVNRASSMGSNFSKPYQAQLIRQQGFLVPETLITNHPTLARQFFDEHRKVIYKSVSGTRSIVRLIQPDDLIRLDSIRWCPTQFQEFVEGFNLRVHTIGKTSALATRIVTTATDYRYSRSERDQEPTLESFDLPADLAERCLKLAQSLELAFAGIDLKITPEDEVYCFEVNPCPAFSYYESATGQPIGRSVAKFLAGREA